MKEYIDIYGNKGKKTNDGTIRLTIHPEYARLETHNGNTLAIRKDKIKEVITMLEHIIQ